MFTIEGTHIESGSFGSITWDDGELTGDPDFVAFAEERAEGLSAVGPVGGPYWEGEDKLGEAIPAALIITNMLRDWQVVAGELEDLPFIPDGAIP